MGPAPDNPQTGRNSARGTAVLKMNVAPFSFRWIAEHTDYEENRLFRDQQKKGPFALWIHTHRFEPDGTDACHLEDHIEYALPFHPLGNMVGASVIRKKLERIFDYRHRITALDMADHLSIKDQKPLNILISGAGGLIGSGLVPFLTAGGHHVTRLVRRPAASEKNEVCWDPASGHLNPDDIEGTDTVIHLSGENIGTGRWTEGKRKKIIESRTKSTRLIAETMTKLSPMPRVLVCASAIGWYGNRGNTVLTEKDVPGNDFISHVCEEWEKAAVPAVEKGIRVVFMRIGVVLTPAGGALGKVLPLFKLGIGGKAGTGSQYMSWIGTDDVIGAVYHVISDDRIHGPVNTVSPNPVTNLGYTETLGRVLSRPTLLPVPAAAIKLAFGRMGREILLSGARVMPDRLLETGYRFRNPDLEGALRHLLGKKH